MQQLNPSEISEIIKQRIAKLDVSAQARNEGTIVSLSDGIVRIHGLADVKVVFLVWHSTWSVTPLVL